MGWLQWNEVKPLFSRQSSCCCLRTTTTKVGWLMVEEMSEFALLSEFHDEQSAMNAISSSSWLMV